MALPPHAHSTTAAGSPFDAVAGNYDAHFTGTLHGRRLRRQVWDVLDAYLQPGMRLLDAGCGTGTDARHLAGRGVEVLGIDRSSEMARLAGLACAALEPSPRFEVGDLDRWSPPLAGSWDAVLADFGVLNCMPDLPAVADRFRAWLRPGGAAVVVVMGRSTPAEWLWFGLRGKWSQAARRFRNSVRLGAVYVPVYYHSPRRLRSAFSRGFRLRLLRGLGWLFPPEMEASLSRVPAVHRFLVGWEERLGGGAPFNRWGDHTLAVFERE